ncbi:hypothetical protein GCM10011487_57210 [Steroidobacter agaridevorans]|uniref:AB hydrolase-1 domain-containing protein n=1 Tax=Steroidobacter agaridevorans TaxID=2695856 RepID=A0A829YLH2_9GAMM|nr:alpha/beta fold hydrolase [Steroidobacter agaridevorans]GFE83721.1 hypothetical protein GCM10011487_57210 [Steroidobacter agaridevorans]
MQAVNAGHWVILCGIKWALTFGLATFQSTCFGLDAPQSGYAQAHDGTNIYYEVHGTGKKFLLLGHYMHPESKSLNSYVDGLGERYRIIVTDYPGTSGRSEDAKLYTFTPAALARDHLSILDAVGAREFAYYGYSFDAAIGLQLALRTNRMKAFIAGGFPMMNGPYQEMLKSLRANVIDRGNSPHTPEIARQYLTYVEGLQSFDDRSAQRRLKMPRLNFLGVDDKVPLIGNGTVDFYGIFVASKRDLETAGWDVIAIPGKDHVGAAQPDVTIPLIRKWLDKNWID